MTHKRTSINFLLDIPALLLIALIIFELYHFFTLPVVRQTFAVATTVRQEALTELYFENSAGLPQVIVPGSAYSVSFTIHNLEGQNTTYPVAVLAQTGFQTTVLSRTDLTLKSDQSVTVGQTIGPFDNFPTKIIVRLDNKNQFISFWMEAK